jgi:hypothetical protein
LLQAGKIPAGECRGLRKFNESNNFPEKTNPGISCIFDLRREKRNAGSIAVVQKLPSEYFASS